MEKTLPLEERSIYQVYLESQDSKIYKIPVYQRNYAWEEIEISSLIKDVYDSYHKDSQFPYYIGTLVTYKRGDNEYEVIDGQQRLTTIYIILTALGINTFRNKLTYTARKVSAQTINNLCNYPNLGEEIDNGIRNGYFYASKAIEEIIDKSEKKDFEQYFLHNVHIIHYEVPKDVDLNHYFEVMNSRGEQLEKHEIVKSMLSQNLKKRELATFSRVWEACSEMNIYIQQAMPDKTIFGYNLNKFIINNFADIPEQDESEGKDTIMNLIKRPISKLGEGLDSELKDKFQPIIDFPNLLLIVLKLTRIKTKDFDPVGFTLDDKELLNEFIEALRVSNNKAEFARKFLYNLLKAKFLLDNYVVHHVNSDKESTGDNPWKLQYYYLENSKKRYPKNLTSSKENQKELVHLLSMFEVSFTPKQRKNYLFYCLMFLFDEINLTDKNYLEFLQHLADKYFYDVYLDSDSLNERNQPGPNAFDSTLLKSNGDLNVYEIGNENFDYKTIFENIYQQGKCDVPLFVFNYMDYILWKMYSDELRGNKTTKVSKNRNDFFKRLGCSDFELEPFANFYFSRTRKSLEHYYPQAKAVKDENATDCDITTSQINCFGNFAMIGAEANSSGSNWDPMTKLDHYNDGKADPISVASLKFKIMMQICQDNHKSMLNGNLRRNKGMEWNYDDIMKHQKNMLNILFGE